MNRQASAVLLAFVFVAAMLAGPAVLAQGPPPGWGKPAPLPPANGTGQVTFKQGGMAMTLPLNKIEIQQLNKDLRIISLTYVDAAQENELDLTFATSPAVKDADGRMISGFVVRTKAKGLSKGSANRTKFKFAVTKNDGKEVAGTLSATGMTEMSATEGAPDVTDVVFSGRLN